MNNGKTIAAGIILALVVALAHASSAWGHDSLIASSPGAGDELQSGPSEITLTFSGQLLEGGAAVAVFDSGSRDWVADSPAVEDMTATVELDEALPDGEYEVLWRVVSSDGHPISGAFTFQVGVGGSDDTASRVADPAAADRSDEPAGFGLWAGLVAVLAMAAAVTSLWFFWRRTTARGAGK